MNEAAEPNRKTKKRGVEVVVRIRPFETSGNSSTSAISINSSPTSPSGVSSSQVTVLDRYAWCGVGEERSFTVDGVLDANTSNAEVFRLVVEPKLMKITREKPDALCFLAYGHTCSGKTHTIAGGERQVCSIKDEKDQKKSRSSPTSINEEKKLKREPQDSKLHKSFVDHKSGKSFSFTDKKRDIREVQEKQEEPGLLTLCVKKILDCEGVVEIAMLEVYMEQIYDLLALGAQRRIRRRRHSSTGEYHIVVEGLKTCVITNMDQWNVVSHFSMNSRRVTATERNSRSSRSHALFTLKSPSVRLCLVDLAGSERQTTFSTKLNRESVSINKSLSRLSTALQALSQQSKGMGDGENGKRAYVNFRDTALTVLLQRYLTGTSQTTFLACVHPEERHIHETMSTLRYTERIRRIVTSTYSENGEGEDDHTMMMMALYDEEASDRHLLKELVRLRQQVKDQEETRELLVAHQKRIAELEASLLAQQSELSSRYPSVSLSPSMNPSTPGTYSLHESGKSSSEEAKSTVSQEGRLAMSTKVMDKELPINRRLTRWLLLRLLRALPPLHVRFDGYFDALLPRDIQVVGYVTTMASFPPPPYSRLRVFTSPTDSSASSPTKVELPEVKIRTRSTGVRRSQLPHHLRRRGLFDDVSSSSSDEYSEESEDITLQKPISHATTPVGLERFSSIWSKKNNTDKKNVGLAFIEVGDFSVGLSMLDAGIPPLVRLHCPRCQSISTKSRGAFPFFEDGSSTKFSTELDKPSTSGASGSFCPFSFEDPVTGVEREREINAADYAILAFFQVSPETVKEEAQPVMKRGKTDELPSESCCAAIVSREPLLPIAIVCCVRADAPLRIKEIALQRLALLIRTEQAGKCETGQGNRAHHSTIMESHAPPSSASMPPSEIGRDGSPGSRVSASASLGLSSSRSRQDEEPSTRSTATGGESDPCKQMIGVNLTNSSNIQSTSGCEKERKELEKRSSTSIKNNLAVSEKVEEMHQRTELERTSMAAFLSFSPSSCSSEHCFTDLKSAPRSQSESLEEKVSPVPAPPHSGTSFSPRYCGIPMRGGLESENGENEHFRTPPLQEKHERRECTTFFSQLDSQREEMYHEHVGLLDIIAHHEKRAADPLIRHNGCKISTTIPFNAEEESNDKLKRLINAGLFRNNDEGINPRASQSTSSTAFHADGSTKEDLHHEKEEQEVKTLHLLKEEDAPLMFPVNSCSHMKDAFTPSLFPSSSVVVEMSPERSFTPLSAGIEPSDSPCISPHAMMQKKEKDVLALLPSLGKTEQQQETHIVLEQKMKEEISKKTKRNHHHHRHHQCTSDTTPPRQMEKNAMQQACPQSPQCDGVIVSCNSSFCEDGHPYSHTSRDPKSSRDAPVVVSPVKEEIISSHLPSGGEPVLSPKMKGSSKTTVKLSSFDTISAVSSGTFLSNGTPRKYDVSCKERRKCTCTSKSVSRHAVLPSTESKHISASSFSPHTSTETRNGREPVDSAKCDTCVVM